MARRRMLSDEIRVMLAPAGTYADLVRDRRATGAPALIGRLLFVALVQGIAISMVATRSVAAPVVASVTLCWTLALAVQLIAAAVFVLTAPHRAIGVARALDLLYAGHAPWTVWLLVCAAALTWGSTVSGMPWIAVLTMAVPAAVTVRILSAFDRIVLGTAERAAARRTAIHQSAIWMVLIAFFATAVQLWPRLVGGWPL